MRTLVLLLEERSAREMLEGLLPRILPDDVQVRYIVFEGKQDLEKQLIRKLRGWKAPESTFVVLRDQDAGDCFAVKNVLTQKCHSAGHPETIVRIACRELESWYLGDLAAVETALQLKGIARQQDKSRYRNPDAVVQPSAELVRLTHDVYQKVSGSRAIGPLLSLDQNQSHSFRVFIAGINGLFQ
jgi:hypothetical protein